MAGNPTYSPVILPLGNSIFNNPISRHVRGRSASGVRSVHQSVRDWNLRRLLHGRGRDLQEPGLPPRRVRRRRQQQSSERTVDEWGEGVNSSNQALVTGNLQRHTHNTARSEMLYAILVEGRGPLGSVFSRDDFTDKEVQDTDGDGLPEFVDAWGQPLQFFRWPLLYHSDLQRGQVISSTGAPVDQSSTPPPAGTLLLPYKTVYEEREQDPLDVNQQLMAPSWWSSVIGRRSTNYSPFGQSPGAREQR